jgi:hypothetical protein
MISQYFTFRIVEDIKRNDHRNLSKQLHRFTADAIAEALLEVQREGIAAIRYIDALICQEEDRERVCEVIGTRIFEATGVCCTVGGIRYSPLAEKEKQALAFDQIAPSNDGMDYDEWEAMRVVKTAAMLKLTRFTRHVVSANRRSACKAMPYVGIRRRPTTQGLTVFVKSCSIGVIRSEAGLRQEFVVFHFSTETSTKEISNNEKQLF